MPPKDDPELVKLRKELEDLVNKIKDDQKKMADKKLEDLCGDMSEAPKVKLVTKKILKGHINKVNSIHFSGDSRSSWVMSVAFAPSGNFVACGGMDNMCTIYDLNNRDSTGVAKIVRELAGYEGFLSSCRFIDDKTIITGSGDMKMLLFCGKRYTFSHIFRDVVSISLAPDIKTYVTGSVDKTCRLWDLREQKPKQTFFGHTSDVNSVCYHPSGQAFATGSEDKTARLYDIRSDQDIATYKPPNNTSGFTSCGLSLSGRYLLCGSDDSSVHIWDTLKNQHNGCLAGHENRVTSLSVAGNGMAVATSSWDQSVRVWV
ncbi:Guanine nucleotide-binding protein subunit beta-2 [Blattella germanica]|nr:Guanine nucleotide-binding protein subunit beta-2 [Blattella germanica]